MAQFPGFLPDGDKSFGGIAEDVGMTDAEQGDESDSVAGREANSSLTKTMSRFRNALKISPPKLSIPNPIKNYFTMSAAVDPTFKAPPGFPGDGVGVAGSSSNAATAGVSHALPITPVFVPAPDQFPEAAAPVGSPTFRAPAVPFAPAAVPEQKPKAQAQARNKVPVEKGYSQMVWLKFMRSQPDIAGLKGASPARMLSMEEINQHRDEGNAWTILRGRVYNIAPYLKFHPGGREIMMTAAGIDCTALFNEHHSWVNAEFLLEKCQVGFVDQGQGSGSN